MATLSDVTKTLEEQNRILGEVSEGVNETLREQIAQRVISERQRGDALEAEIEAKNKRTSDPSRKVGTISQEIRRGAAEGLGVAGILGKASALLSGLLGGMVGGVSVSTLAATGAGMLTKLLTRGAVIGLLANFGKQLFTKMVEGLDPSGAVISPEDRASFAEKFNFAVMGGIILKTVGSLFGKRISRLFGTAGMIAGWLYPSFNEMLDDTALEKSFNDAFETEFGSEIMAGIGSAVAGIMGTVLGVKILKLVRSTLGLGAATGAAAPGAARGGRTSSQAAAREEVDRRKTDRGKLKPPPSQSTKLRTPPADVAKSTGGQFTRNKAGQLILNDGSNRYAKLDDVLAAVSKEKAAKITRALRYMKILAPVAAAGQAASIALMIANDEPKDDVVSALAGMIGGIGVGYAGSLVGGALGSIALPGVGTVAGGAVGGLAGYFGGEYVATELAKAILGLPQSAPTENQQRIATNMKEDEAVMSMPTMAGDFSPSMLSTIRKAGPTQTLEQLREAGSQTASPKVVVVNNNDYSDNSNVNNVSNGGGGGMTAAAASAIDHRYDRKYMMIKGFGLSHGQVF